MSYATQAQAIAQIGERELIALTDRDNLGTLDSAVLQEALTNASGEIDTYLAARYTTPLSAALPLITTYCIDIARYRLSGADVAEVETVRTRYKDAIRFLESVRDGKTKLPGDVTAAGANASQNLAQVVSSDNACIFSRSNR